MKRRFTKIGSWRDPRTWVNAMERLNDWATVKKGSKEYRQLMWFFAALLLFPLIAALVAFFK